MAALATPTLLADIGGTRARCALAGPEGLGEIREVRVDGFPTAATALTGILEHLGGRPRRAVLAVAGPVRLTPAGGEAHLTNAGWAFEGGELAERLGLERVQLVNDFAAVARAVPELGAGDRQQLGGEAPQAGAPIAILGPGTGLGAAGLAWCGETPLVLAGEGGHVTLAAQDEREAAIIAALRQRFGHVSAERALCGAGLVTLYEVICVLEGREPQQLEPSQVTTLALRGQDPACAEALDLFFALLGAVAGDLVLTLGALGGCWLAGGILPAVLPALKASRFRERFQAKGRFHDYLAPVPVYVITHPHPAFPGLVGFAADLDKAP